MTREPSTSRRAYAKINLSLDVVERREDRFHELRSVMQTVSLYDDLTLSTTSHPRGRAVPADEDAFWLVSRGIETMREQQPDASPIEHEVTKRIPAAAGLGGGSSDCAAAMRGTGTLLELALDDAAMVALAASIGSDVPFFLFGGTALVEGRGELVTPLDDTPKRWFLLARQSDPVPTAKVFSEFSTNDRGDGRATDRVLESLKVGTVQFGGNDLTAAAIRCFPEIGQTFDTLAQVAPPERIAMSGSGGTVVALFEDEDEARAAEATVAQRADWTCVAHSVDRRTALVR
ncbi:MAG TPA: 4-(cytidine 5'-diphospho)-2-C-methyl-D-erythritol kinase [Chloroflexota bacterium]|jgi:4-diphosphocytidyl-2-C-methyl-D-erythritol kinase|nr:4-(cytidine 5'-diphospho)-2-C-methyl-D-erythritol kinase [Chloroflexota bacterium]